MRLLLAAAVVLVSLYAPSALAKEPEQVVFKLTLESGRDGQPVTKSETTLPADLYAIQNTTLRLWTCAARPTTRNEVSLNGRKVTMVGKEVLCFIPDETGKDRFTQMGTAAICAVGVGAEAEQTSFYIRERDLLVRFTLSCKVTGA